MARKTPLAKMIGDKQLIRKLEKLEKKAAKRIEKKVIRAGAGPIKKAIKQLMPVDKGHAKKSIDTKFPKRGGAVIGADANYKVDGERPANYIHLIEFGHVTEDGGVVPGSHPIERGAKAAQELSGQKMTEKTRSELNRLL